MMMPGRKWSPSSYRYGFNGKEKDTDINSLTAYDYGFRIYNPAIGKFLSVDPLMKSYPWYTPYQFAGNMPIEAVDLDGLEEYHYLRFKDKNGNTVLAYLEQRDLIESVVVSTETMFVDNGMGGVSTETIETKRTAKNERQQYVVWSLDEFDLVPYDEKRTFKSLAEAQNCTDKDFVGTKDDAVAVAGILFIEIFVPTAQQTGRPPMRRGKRPPSQQMHHVISKNLKKTSAFVQKAIKGGFKMESVKNLLPLTRFMKTYNTGVHAKHPKYTKQISDHLETVDISKMSDANAAKYLNQLNDYIIDRIKSNKDVKINDLDLKLKDFKFKE